MVGMDSLIPSYIEKVDPELSIDFKVASKMKSAAEF